MIEEFVENMVRIPSGSITMRDDRIDRIWTVNFDSFLVSKYLVTQEVFFEVMHYNPSSFIGNNLPVETLSWHQSVEFCNQLSDKFNLENCYVFSDGKMEFIKNANGFRLLTEAEWEFACKGNVNKPRYGILEEIAWYKQNSDGKTHPVGTKLPNNFGVYDMLGNVWEWCSDIYDEEVYGEYRIIRGGGWCDEERGILSTNRRRSHPKSFKIDDLGFRISRNFIK